MALVQPPGGSPVANLKKKPVGGGSSGGSSAPPVLAPPVVTPPAKKGTTGERAVFLGFIKAHPALNKGNIPSLIWNSVKRYGGITPTQLAVIIWAESKGDPNALSGAGAQGIAQIWDNAASATNAAGVPFFRSNHIISEEDKKNPAFAIQYMAWRIGGYASTHGGMSLDDIWINGYNPNFKNDPNYKPNYISQYLPKGYVGIGGPSAVDKSGASTDTKAITDATTDPFVVGINAKSGKLIVSSSTVPPKNVVMFDGTPLTVSMFSQTARQLDSYFQSYTGGRPSKSIVMNYIKKGWSPYTLTVALSKNKNFTKSPIYKKYAPEYSDAAKDILAPGEKIPNDLVRSAIVNGWDTGTLQAVLRKRDQYVQSNEFKSNTATLLNVHASIMGNPDNGGMNTIKQAALAGWDTNQYAAYLRSQPQYVQSPEYQSKALNFLSSLGLITGQQAVLRKGTTPASANPNPAGFGPLPDDKREPAGKLANAEDTVATYNG